MTDTEPCRFVGYAYVDAIRDAPPGQPYRLTIDQATIDRSNAGEFESRKRVYHDKAVKLTDQEIRSLNMHRVPLKVEHSGMDIGYIINSYVEGDKMLIFGETTDPKVSKAIRTKQLASLSINYDRKFNPATRCKDGAPIVNEVSLVKQPFFDGCNILVAASKQDKQTAVPSRSAQQRQQQQRP
jgi:hypothetical protein